MNDTSGKSIWQAEEWFDHLPADLLRNPLMSDEQFELLIGREAGIAEGANVEVVGLREFLENARTHLNALSDTAKRELGVGGDA